MEKWDAGGKKRIVCWTARILCIFCFILLKYYFIITWVVWELWWGGSYFAGMLTRTGFLWKANWGHILQHSRVQFKSSVCVIHMSLGKRPEESLASVYLILMNSAGIWQLWGLAEKTDPEPKWMWAGSPRLGTAWGLALEHSPYH